MTPSPAPIRVDLGPRSYDVLVGVGLLAALGDQVARVVGRRHHAFVVHDDNLPETLVDEALASLTGAGFDIAEEAVYASEDAKSVETVEQILLHLGKTRHERRDPVIALGGGIVGDLAGFAASVYRRGVPVVQCPTTLLAMVDAAVGGKTGVNLPTPTGLKKNLVGTFWQPSVVIADVAALRTLPARELSAGLAECLKHGLIASGLGHDPSLFDWTRATLGRLLRRDEPALGELVRRNVALKAKVVAGDEREEAPPSAGGRALLNLGHTFAHAIETVPGLDLLHGEAVGLGLVAASACSTALGLLKEADAGTIRAAVDAIGLRTRQAGLPGDEAILETMSHDKKVAGGRLRLVLPTSLGSCKVVEDPPAGAVRAGLAAIRE